MKIKAFVIISIFIFFVGCDSIARQQTTIELKEYKRIDNPARDEVSGIVRSKSDPNIFWVHGDSDQKDEIYAINSDGEVLGDREDGTEIDGAKNKDWEDITVDQDGNIIIADIGNNCRCRDDLKIFVVPEPEAGQKSQKVLAEYDIVYPKRNTLGELLWKEKPDAEAVFVYNGVIRIITKEGGTGRLYSLIDPVNGEINQLVESDRFKFGSLVTAADYSEKLGILAVLTTNSVWLFEVADESTFFSGRNSSTRLKGMNQIEAITFDDNSLIITEEDGELYRIQIEELSPVN